MFDCDGVTVDNVKIVGQWRYNTDGVDIVNTRNAVLKNSFIRAFDDVISIKGIYDCPHALERITVDNCVLWCGWGHTCEVGIETEAPECKDITFKNCDVIHASGYALAIANGSYSDCHHISFHNINVEFQKDTLPEIFQRSVDQEYDGFGKIPKYQFIKLSNNQYGIRTITTDGVIRKNADIPGNIRNITFENIHVYAEEGVTAPSVFLSSIDDRVHFKAPIIDGLYWNGERQTDFSHFAVVLKNTDEVILK
jgi:polygalacturonase